MHQLYFKIPGTLWNQMIPVKVKRDKLIYIYLMMAELKHSDHKSSRFCSLKANMRYIYNKGKSGAWKLNCSPESRCQLLQYKATKLRNYFTLASLTW